MSRKGDNSRNDRCAACGHQFVDYSQGDSSSYYMLSTRPA